MDPTTLLPSAGHVLVAVLTWALNNLSVETVVAVVLYLALQVRRYGAGLVAWFIAAANTLLNLHLSAAQEAALVAAVGREVYAAQKAFVLPADRRDAVVSALARQVPGVDATHVDRLIDAAIATATLTHGPIAWAALAPATTATTSVPQPDLDAITAHARAAGKAEGIAEQKATILAQLGVGQTSPAPETASTAPTAPMAVGTPQIALPS